MGGTINLTKPSVLEGGFPRKLLLQIHKVLEQIKKHLNQLELFLSGRCLPNQTFVDGPLAVWSPGIACQN